MFTRRYKHFLACTPPNIVLTFLPVSTPFSTVSCGYFLFFCRFSLCFVHHFLNHASYHFLSLLSHFPTLSPHFSSMFIASSWFAPSLRSSFLHFPKAFPWFVPSIRSVFVHFQGDPFWRGFCTISSDPCPVFLQFQCIFQCILMVSPATKKADLGGIDNPPSANYLVAHNPAKCSVFSLSTQGHGEISFPFGNHPLQTPYSHFVRKQQLAS